MQDHHEYWRTSFEFDFQDPHKHENMEGSGVYESYDEKGNLVRCGVMKQILAGVSKMQVWSNECKWIIRIPFDRFINERDMRIYKQKLKRFHKRNIKVS